jgi:methylmalonyl-CoA mutase
MYYEGQKLSGELPIIGVNTFLGKDGSPTIIPEEVIRSTDDEKKAQIRTLTNLHKAMDTNALEALNKLQMAAMEHKNIFAELIESVKYCSLGQITNALYEVGGQYRRNM